MHIPLTVLDPARAGSAADVVLTCEPGTTVGSVRHLLATAVGRADGDGATAVYVDGVALDDGDLVGMPPVVAGAVLTVGRPGAPPGRAAGAVGGFLELHVVAGPDAGTVHRLAPGSHVLGRGGEGFLRIADPDCSRVHARLSVGQSGIVLRDERSTNGTWVDGERLGDAPVPITERSVVRIGSSLLRLRVPGAAVAATEPRGDGRVDVNRSPRISHRAEVVTVRMPTPPTAPRRPQVPVVAMVVPLLVAVPLALLWSPMALLFAVMTPVMLVGNLVSDRVSGRREHRRSTAEHAAARARADDRLASALALETSRRALAAPDPAEVLRIGTLPMQRIWERKPSDDDWLVVRLGTANVPSGVVKVDPEVGDDPVDVPLPDSAVTVSLPTVGVLGVAGPRHRGGAVVRSVLGQLVTLHSPRDLAVVVLAATDVTAGAPSGPGDTSLAASSWLPHLAADMLRRGLETCDRLVGVTPDQVRRRVAELVALVDERRRDGARGAAEGSATSVVVLLDGAQRLRRVPGVSRLLSDGPSVGVYTICLDAEPAALPSECGATAVVTGEVTTRLHLAVAAEEPLPDVVADLPSAAWFERLARGLARLRDATPDDVTGTLPSSARLLEVVTERDRHDPTDPAETAHRWLERPRSTTAVLGVAAGGPFAVDLVTDGPHLLVGGTTGSGKSELLQTLITALALGNRPDEMGFVLVDYKGGAAFAQCAGLPHTLGLVTDLDEALTRRALASLEAEVGRRERLLARYGAKDLQDYQSLVDEVTGDERGRPPRLGRLVLVIDEFRVLAEELPAFLDGLVRLAAVGRSLGIHLVLATQRPGGVVGADVKANVNLRICLRVRDAVDSLDVVEVRDAATISERCPGRALARAGSGPVVEFQTGRVGGWATESGPAEASARTLSWTTAGDPPARPASVVGGHGRTDLARTVDALRAAAALIGVRTPASPWLPALPERLTLDDVAAPGPATGDQPWTSVPVGLVDDPHRQRQVAATFDLTAGGGLAVAGSARSGRTQLLRTLAASATVRCPAGDLAIYALDGGAGLAALERLPTVGAVVAREDAERATRLLRRLTEEVARRQRVLAVSGCADVAEHRRAHPRADRLPYLLLLVDGWESLQQTHAELDTGLAEGLLQLVAQGPGVGLQTVVAGDRSVLSGRWGSSLAQRLVLRLADPSDALLAGVSPRDVPGDLPPGRGLWVTSSGHELIQVALLAEEVDGTAQVRALDAVAAARASDATVATVPFTVPAMPDVVSVREVVRLLHDHECRGDVGPPGAAHPRWLPVGLGGPHVTPVGLDLDADGPRVLVAGHPGSGRSSALSTLGAGLLEAGVPVALVSPSPARSARPSVGQLPAEGARNGQAALLGVFGPEDGAGLTRALEESLAAGRPAAVLVDDADQLEGGDLEALLCAVEGRLATTGEVLVVAGSTPQMLGRFQGLTVQVRKGATGLLLGPGGPVDGDLFGVRAGRRAERRPGRGMLVRRGQLVPVQVALPAPPTAQEVR